VKSILKTSLNLTLEVEVKSSMLPAIPEEGLPEQIDITAVNILVPGIGNRSKRLNILALLTEQELMLLEDEVMA